MLKGMKERKPSRFMLPVTKGRDTIATYPGPYYCFNCEACGRWGEYRREIIQAEFPGEMHLPSLLEAFAKTRGCPVAIPDRSPYDFTSAKCHVKFRIAAALSRETAR